MQDMNVYVTTSLKASPALEEEARTWARQIRAPFIERGKETTGRLLEQYGPEGILVYTATGPEIVTPQGKHRFHLSMAELRIQHLRQGRPDHLLEAVGAAGPVRVLDCTCGFGADSLVLSFGLPAGSVVDALESSPFLAAVTGWGFRHFVHDCDDVTAALRRITLHHVNYADYLSAPDAPSYDILYFDPMFSHPVEQSPQFQPVRPLMDHSMLQDAYIAEALQKARRKVIVKGRSFRRLGEAHPGFTVQGGKYSRIGYAVWECKGL